MTGLRRVLVTDGISESGLDLLRETPGVDVVRIDDSGSPEFATALASASALIVRSVTKVTAAMLEGAPALAVVGRAGVGVDNIDVAAATQRGVAVLNAPAGNSTAAAELTMALILAVVRKVAEADRAVRGGQWERNRLRGVELRGRTLGLIGAGRIGGLVAQRARAFGMNVIVHDPHLSEDRAADLDMPMVDLDDLLTTADIVTLHVPMTTETKGMIDASALALMRRGSFLVNVSRGGVVVETDLAASLEAGHLAGAALDVFEEEPLASESPLLRIPNLVLTPHLGASTAEAQEQVAVEICAAVRLALVEGNITNAVNAASLAGVSWLAPPLLEMGRRLGVLGGALTSGGVLRVEVRYRGESESALDPLARSVVMGLLANVVGADELSGGSALQVAEERGIGVIRRRLDRHADYAELVDVRIHTDGGKLRLAGALLGDMPRLVRFDKFHLDVAAAGTLILAKGGPLLDVMGKWGELASSRRLVISEYHQARARKSGEVLVAISVEGVVDTGVVTELSALGDVSSAWVVPLEDL